MTSDTKRNIAVGASLAIMVGIFVAVYVDHRREPVWLESPPQLDGPILVGISPGLREHEGDILMAIAQVNEETRCTVFSLTTESNAKVVLKWLDSEACGLGDRAKVLDVRRHTEGMWDCKNGTAEVQFADLADPFLRFPTIVHALGHVAGLAHDFSGPSVMRDPPPPMVQGGQAPGLTPKDARALQKRFCP